MSERSRRIEASVIAASALGLTACAHIPTIGTEHARAFATAGASTAPTNTPDSVPRAVSSPTSLPAHTAVRTATPKPSLKPKPKTPAVPHTNSLTAGCGNRGGEVLMTFDDSDTPEGIKQTVRTLNSKRVGAIFFVNNGRVSSDTITYVRTHGIWVGNHTKTHDNVAGTSDSYIDKEIRDGPESDVFRPPYGGFLSSGVYDKNITKQANKLGYRICDWTVDTEDWKRPPVAKINRTIKTEIRPGAVILQHLFSGYTHKHLAQEIDMIRGMGYTLVPPAPGPTTPQIPFPLAR